MKKQIVRLLENVLCCLIVAISYGIVALLFVGGSVLKLEEVAITGVFKKFVKHPLEATLVCLLITACLIFTARSHMTYQSDRSGHYPFEAQRQYMQTEMYAKFGGFRM